MHYVYVLRNKNNQLYIGSTNNLRLRIRQHQKGLVASTRSREPQLVYYEAYISEYLARIREKRLKHFGSAYTELKKRIEKGAAANPAPVQQSRLAALKNRKGAG